MTRMIDSLLSNLPFRPGKTAVEPKLSFLIVGLGNPGQEFKSNRHNMGFLCVDRLAGRLEVSFSRLESKALVTKADYEGRRCILAKPQTYMNLSGQSISGLVRFYKIPLDNVLVAHDDVDLPLGALRLRPNGGSGGQKGVASIIERLGTKDFPRLRIGIGRPPGRMDTSAYVLQNFTPSDGELLDITLEKAVDAALDFVTNGLEAAMNKHNSIGQGT